MIELNDGKIHIQSGDVKFVAVEVDPKKCSIHVQSNHTKNKLICTARQNGISVHFEDEKQMIQFCESASIPIHGLREQIERARYQLDVAA